MQQGYARHNEILDLAEREAANNASLMNAILDDSEPSSQTPANPSDSPLTPILHAISVDFSNRWRGGLFSLDPLNPDAARHFCSSTREIIAGILNTSPTSAVRHDFHLIWPIWSTNRVCFLCLDLLGGRVVPTYPLD